MRERGFTLLELMIVVVIVAFVALIGVPGMRTLMQNNRASTSANNLVSAMQIARSEALKRGTSVTVCASNDAKTCSGSWEQGWIVATDTALGDNAPTIDTVLRVSDGLSGGTSLTEAGDKTFVRYQASGLVSGVRSFSLQVPDCTGDHARKIDISVTGRVSVEASACQ